MDASSARVASRPRASLRANVLCEADAGHSDGEVLLVGDWITRETNDGNGSQLDELAVLKGRGDNGTHDRCA